MQRSRKIISEKEWDTFGKHLIFLTHHDGNDEDYHRQCRLLKMWEDPSDHSPQPAIIFNEIKVSEKLFKKFEEMALEEENSK